MAHTLLAAIFLLFEALSKPSHPPESRAFSFAFVARAQGARPGGAEPALPREAQAVLQQGARHSLHALLVLLDESEGTWPLAWYAHHLHGAHTQLPRLRFRQVYKKTHITKTELRTATTCQRENPFYIDTVIA
eukprot:6152713-Pleurochrysis_carterae.AAC.2